MTTSLVLTLTVYVILASSVGAMLIYYRYWISSGRQKSSVPELVPSSLASEISPSNEEAAVHAPAELPEIALDRLRLQVWRSRRRRIKLVGRLYLAGGLVFLVAGYFTGYLGFEVMSAVMIPAGVFFTFAGVEPYMKSTLAGQSVISTMRVLREALSANSDEGHAIFVPGKDRQSQVRMFIPSSDAFDASVPGEWTAGHFYTPLGHDLFQAYVHEVGGKTEGNIASLLDQLRTVTTSGLEMVDDVQFEVSQSQIKVQIKNATFAEIGRYPDLVDGVFRKSGCPVTNSMAEWISFGTGLKVKWVDGELDPIKRTAAFTLTLIPAATV